MGWPTSVEALVDEQRRLAGGRPPPWAPPVERPLAVAGCFVAFGHGVQGAGAAGDPGWAGAAVVVDGRVTAVAVADGPAGGPYVPGALAVREGPLLEAAVRALPEPPDVLLVNATGRDHPRRAGMAVHLGAVLGLPSAGVTHRPLVAAGGWPDDVAGAASPVLLEGRTVGAWVRTAPGARPLVAHAGWRTGVAVAVAVVRVAAGAGPRTPVPVRAAREAARSARAAAEGHPRPSP